MLTPSGGSSYYCYVIPVPHLVFTYMVAWWSLYRWVIVKVVTFCSISSDNISTERKMRSLLLLDRGGSPDSLYVLHWHHNRKSCYHQCGWKFRLPSRLLLIQPQQGCRDASLYTQPHMIGNSGSPVGLCWHGWEYLAGIEKLLSKSLSC